MNKTVAVVVTYNRKVLLEECINALIKQTNPLDIIIVDNFSNDGTEEVVKKYLSDNVKYYNTGANLGGAGGFNYGMKKATEGNYKYCWIMDDDTIPNSDALENMEKKAQEINDEFSFLNSVVLWTDGSLCKMNVPKVTSNAIKGYKSLDHGLLQIDSCSFVSCFINMKYIYEIGFPIIDFFIYGDDMEYTMRLSEKAPGYLNPHSIVVHKMGSNVGINIIDIEKNRIDRYFYNFRNLCYIYRKYDQKEYKMHKLKAKYLILKALFKSKDSKFKRARVIRKGMRAGKKFNPEIEFPNKKEN